MTKQEKRMVAAVKKLQDYMNSYDGQDGYEGYSDTILIDDVLYGLGVALDDKYRFGNGYEDFKALLREHLKHVRHLTRIAELTEALRRYGNHEIDCDYIVDELPCTCGFGALLKSVGDK